MSHSLRFQDTGVQFFTVSDFVGFAFALGYAAIAPVTVLCILTAYNSIVPTMWHWKANVSVRLERNDSPNASSASLGIIHQGLKATPHRPDPNMAVLSLNYYFSERVH